MVSPEVTLPRGRWSRRSLFRLPNARQGNLWNDLHKNRILKGIVDPKFEDKYLLNRIKYQKYKKSGLILPPSLDRLRVNVA